MVIGIEAERANAGQKTGVEHYTKQLILHLAKLKTEHQFILYLRSKPEAWLLSLPENFRIKTLGYGPVPFPFLWTQVRLSWEMLLRAPDILFVPAASLPAVHPKKSYVTIHDVAWRIYPKTFKMLKRLYLEFIARFACKFAAKIIAVSQATKNDLIKFYGIAGSKIAVVHHGFEETPVQPEIPADSPLLPEKYALFLSTLQPRKNLEGLIEAFKMLKTECPDLPHKLVVAGKPGWKFERILKKIGENKDIVIYLNHVSDASRLAIMKKADLLVLPSFYEGFGMQILEAFAAGTPVAVSNVSSLPEVAGEAAAYFDPKDTRDLAKAIKAVLSDQSLADRLRQKGKDRLQLFSWEKCAKETLEVLTEKDTAN
ncbi:MAG: glycosyltransferase family 4 protein [Patescibacteria group bacterium]|nr:glycosyltransferase family 4 protein [Patescibacteria group bacterium]